jgi:hypothetical protein
MAQQVQIKNPNAEPTDKQLAFYNTLAVERGLPPIDAFAAGTTRKGASEAIEGVKALPKLKDQLPTGNLPAEDTQSLTEMAAAIGKPQQQPPASTYDCSWCSDTGVFEEKDIGFDEETGPIYRTIYCTRCDKGLDMKHPSLVGKRVHIPYADSAAVVRVETDDREAGLVTLVKVHANEPGGNPDDWTHPLIGEGPTRVERAAVLRMVK